jgi:hypothetical protein
MYISLKCNEQAEVKGVGIRRRRLIQSYYSIISIEEYCYKHNKQDMHALELTKLISMPLKSTDFPMTFFK